MWSAEEWRALLTGPPEGAAQALEQAARGGMALAQLYYGQFLLDGRGVAADPRAALHWFHQAAQAGLPMAMNMVGRCFDQGWGVAEDPRRRWRGSARQRIRGWTGGSTIWPPCSALGAAWRRTRRSLDLFRQASAQGHAKSTNMVGIFHEDGWATPQNDLLAAYHFARAAEGGDFRGAFNHARMLIEAGQMEEALTWWRPPMPGGMRVSGIRWPTGWPRARRNPAALARQWGAQQGRG
jgi:TPR repeat protein